MQTGSHVFAVVGAKGGVGKTTTSVNLGAFLADAGHTTVVVELDLAMANLVDVLTVDVDVSEDPTLHDVLAGTAPVEAACYDVSDCFSIAVSGTDLDGYVDTDLSRLPAVIETLRTSADVVLLDTPAGLSDATVRPLQLADEAVLVTTPRVASIRNAYNTLELANRVDTDVRGLVVTKSGTGAAPMASRIAEFLDVDLLGYVPADDAVPHSQDNGTALVAYAPGSDAGIEYRNIANTLLDGGDAPTDVAPAAAGGTSEETQASAGALGGHLSDDRSRRDTDLDSTGTIPAELAELVEADIAETQYVDATAREGGRAP